MYVLTKKDSRGNGTIGEGGGERNMRMMLQIRNASYVRMICGRDV